MGYTPFDLTGKVALVTGGNRGIGLGMAEALAQAGADIVVWGSSAEHNATAEAKLKAIGVRVLAQQVDVAEETQVVDAMVEAVARMGRVDSVFANAGISGGARSFSEFDAETYCKVLGVNLDGVFFTLREACKHMVERANAGDKGGSLVAISSVSAIHGAPRNQAYAAAKAAIMSMVRAIAVEHARYGVRANSILPGWIATDLTQASQQNEKFVANVISRVPARRWGEPADFGGIAVYLASDASAFHSGDSIVIDGGYTVY
ncbi:MAG TPA: SDR family oxidoreductase [Caulobacteraceae bacterium]|nr:SDR family oxidoreductase [Caulobacteraceae bacterium]